MPAQGKKRKGYYIKCAKGKAARQSNDLGSGCKGFLITCNNGNSKLDTREATNEAYRILNEYGDLKYGPETKENDEEEDENEDVNLEDALQKEVSTIKESNSKGAARRFQQLKCKIKGCMFIQTSLSDPSELTDSIFEDLITTQVRKTKICLRFLPVILTCHASTEKIIETVKEVCKPIFVEQVEAKKIRFCFVWQVTANSSLKRDDVIPHLCTYVCSMQEHITDYTDPEIAVNMRIIGNICCISVLKNYLRFCKYNIDSIVKPVKEEDGRVVNSIVKPVEEKDGGVVDSNVNPVNAEDGVVDSIVKPVKEEDRGVIDSVVKPEEEKDGGVVDPNVNPVKEEYGVDVDSIVKPGENDGEVKCDHMEDVKEDLPNQESTDVHD